MNRKLCGVFLLIVSVILAFSCQSQKGQDDPKSVVVFVPGVVAGSPIYEMLVDGAQKAVAEHEGARIKVIEAGFDQSSWQDQIRDIAASGEFDIFVSSNPSLPELCEPVAADYPEMRFLIADSYLKGSPGIHTVLYNQLEQGYLVGLLAGLVSSERGAKPVAGLIAAQRYPTLDRLIQPGFEAGLKAVDNSFRLEYREIGNWFDAGRAQDLARALYEQGVEVILPIAGGAGQGVIASAIEKGKSVVWFDGSGYDLAPGTVIGCAILAQDKLIHEKLKAVLEGDAPWGRADIVSAVDGYIDFDFDGQAYRDLPGRVREAFEKAVAALKAGQPDFSFDDF